MNKEDLSDKINELLGLSENPIDFTKLTKEDLIKLSDVVENLSLGGGLFGKKLLSRPIGDIMDMRLRDVIKEMREGKGLLGLGLIRSFIEERSKR